MAAPLPKGAEAQGRTSQDHFLSAPAPSQMAPHASVQPLPSFDPGAMRALSILDTKTPESLGISGHGICIRMTTTRGGGAPEKVSK